MTDLLSKRLLDLEHRLDTGRQEPLTGSAIAFIRSDVQNLEALLQQLLDAYIDACTQGAGMAPMSAPGWHMFLSTYEEAEDLIPIVRKALNLPET